MGVEISEGEIHGKGNQGERFRANIYCQVSQYL